MDLEKDKMVSLEFFLRLALDNSISFTEKDLLYIRKNLESNGKVNYEEIIKDLTLVYFSQENKGQGAISVNN